MNKKVFFIILLPILILGTAILLWHKNNSKFALRDEELKEKIGQMIMIGFRGTEAPANSHISNVIKDLKVGGVILSDYDVPSKSFPRNIVNPEQTKKLIADLQSYSSTPLLVAIDAEGGKINRLKKEYGFFDIISPKEMAESGILTTIRESRKLAIELKELGINLNLAPVVDVDINPDNPVIGALNRSFSSDAEKVAEYAAAFIKEHNEAGIIAAVKHFPGYGSSINDAHWGIADVTDTYQEKELIPYTELHKLGLLDAVMATHIINKNVDENYPATLSFNFLQKILRQQMGFNGVIISDDMRMKAIADNYGFEEAIIKAVNAGCDILLFPNNSETEDYDEKLPYKVRDILYKAVKNGEISPDRIIESYQRIYNLKRRLETLKEKSESTKEIKDRNFELVGTSEILTFGEAVSLAEYVEKITDVRPAFLLAILQEEAALEKTSSHQFDFCYLTNFKTGEGVRIATGEALARVMNPVRDIPPFLSIMQELKKDPLKTPVTCPMSFGWGGAMGPADFIPSTWLRYKNKLESITGKAANPWDIEDAFLAAGLYLSDSGAGLKNRQGEWDAAMLYFSLSTTSSYTWYANDVLTIADKLQADIDIIAQLK